VKVIEPNKQLLLGIFVIGLVVGLGVVFQGQDLPSLNDPVAVLEKQIERGEVKLDYTPGGWDICPVC
jgi:hypothetical protein